MLTCQFETFSQVSQKTDSLKYKKFIPDYAKLQFAGGIGFLSIGTGYTFFKTYFKPAFRSLSVQ
jgi:hypothetical protein